MSESLTQNRVKKFLKKFLSIQHADLFIVFLIFLAVTTTIYFPALNGEILYWDDDFNLLSSPLNDLGKLWTEYYYGLYIPVSYTVWALISKICQPPQTWLFHCVNIILHSANGLLVFLIIQWILKNKARLNKTLLKDKNAFCCSLFGSLIFLVHPVQVDTVAWISGLRDLLSTFFLLLFTLRILEKKESSKLDFISIVLFTLSLFTKPIGLTFLMIPFFIYLKFFELSIKKALKLISIPFLFSVVIGVGTRLLQNDDLFLKGLSTWKIKPWIAIDALFFYLSKIAFPWHLAVDHGRTPSVLSQEPLWYFYFLGFLAIFLAFIFIRNRSDKIFSLAIIWFLFSLLPVLGLVPFAFQAISTVSEHYLYLPLVGISLLLSYLASKSHFAKKDWLFFLIIISFGIRSYARVPIWNSNEAFFNQWQKDNPLSSKGYTGAGTVCLLRKDYPVAEQLFRKALEVKPSNPVAMGNLTHTLWAQEKYKIILSEVKPKVLDPHFIEINQYRKDILIRLMISIGQAHEILKERESAQRVYCQALSLDPDNPELLSFVPNKNECSLFHH